MKSNIESITLNPNNPEMIMHWWIGHNCDEIRLEFHAGKTCYLPIQNKISRKCFNAETIERVTYTDGSSVEYKQTTA